MDNPSISHTLISVFNRDIEDLYYLITNGQPKPGVTKPALVESCFSTARQVKTEFTHAF